MVNIQGTQHSTQKRWNQFHTSKFRLESSGFVFQVYHTNLATQPGVCVNFKSTL